MNKPSRLPQGRPSPISAQEQVRKQRQSHPGVIQPMMAAAPPKQPVAPPVYRPQPVPRVLQRKAVLKQQPLACQSKPAPATPHVHLPQPTHKVLQTKVAANRPSGSSETRNRPFAPPAQRPASQKIVRPQTATVQALRTPNAVQAHLHPTKQAPSGKAGQPVRPIQQHNPRSVIQRKYNYDEEFEIYTAYVDKTQNNAKIMRRLKAAQDAVIYTQNKLKHGPGNIRQAREESQGMNMSAVRVARETAPDFFWESDLRRRAIAARRAQGGNCDEHGVVAYYRLVQNADTSDYAYLCASDYPHVFAILADPPGVLGSIFSRLGDIDESTAVVADAWLKPSFAVTFNHWSFKTSDYKILESSQCHGGAQGGNLLKKTRAEDISDKIKRGYEKLRIQREVYNRADDLYKDTSLIKNMYWRNAVLDEITAREVGIDHNTWRLSRD